MQVALYQVRRLTDDKEKLATQLAQEKSRRTTDSKLSEELASNAILMNDILNRQLQIKKFRELDFRTVKELQRNSSTQLAVLERLRGAVHSLKQKQGDRKVVREENHQLWALNKGVKEQLAAQKSSAQENELALKAEAAAARDELRLKISLMERECVERLTSQQAELEASSQADLARSKACSDASLFAFRACLEGAENESAALRLALGDDQASASLLLADVRRQYEEQLAEGVAALDSERVGHQQKLTEVQAELTEVQAELTREQQGHATVSADVEMYRLKLEAVSASLAEAREAASSSQQENLAKAMAGVTEIASLNQALSKSVSAAKVADTEIEKLSSQLQAVTGEREQLQESMRQQAAAAEAAAQAAAEVAAQVAASHQEHLEAHERERAQLSAQLTSAEGERAQLSAQLTSAEGERAQLSAQLTSAEGERDQLRESVRQLMAATQGSATVTASAEIVHTQAEDSEALLATAANAAASAPEAIGAVLVSCPGQPLVPDEGQPRAPLQATVPALNKSSRRRSSSKAMLVSKPQLSEPSELPPPPKSSPPPPPSSQRGAPSQRRRTDAGAVARPKKTSGAIESGSTGAGLRRSQDVQAPVQMYDVFEFDG